MSEYHFSCKSNTLTNKHQLSANFHPLAETYCRGCCHCCCCHCHASSLSNYLWSQAWGWLVLQGRQYHAVSTNSSLKIRKGASIHHPISKHLYLYTKILREYCLGHLSKERIAHRGLGKPSFFSVKVVPPPLKGLFINLTSFLHMLNFVWIKGVVSFILVTRVHWALYILFYGKMGAVMSEREEQVELWPPESSMGAKSTSTGVLSVLISPASPLRHLSR